MGHCSTLSAPTTYRQDGHQSNDEHHAEHRSFDAVTGGDQVDTGGKERQRDDHPVQESLRIERSMAPIKIVDPVQLLLDHRPSLRVSFCVNLQRILVSAGVRPTVTHSVSLDRSSRGRSKLDASGSSNGAGNSASGSACVQMPSAPDGKPGTSSIGVGGWTTGSLGSQIASGSSVPGVHEDSASGDDQATPSSSAGEGRPGSTSPACSKAEPMRRAPVYGSTASTRWMARRSRLCTLPRLRTKSIRG